MALHFRSITLAELAGLEMEGKEFIVDGDEQNIKIVPATRKY
jgi:hypothetical protein